MRGYDQESRIYYTEYDIASPVTNDMGIRIIMTLSLIVGWIFQNGGYEGAFLHGDFEDEEGTVYMKVPEGFDKYFTGENTVLMLLKTIYEEYSQGLLEVASEGNEIPWIQEK